VDVEMSTSWKDKRWIVRSERLGVFATKIERKYDVVIVFEDTELEDYKISATLEEETIEQLLNAIRLTIPMDYRIERHQVYVRINQQLKKKYDRLIHNK
jgi:ferric-dicitrate binding protein FerR (iron transport regulator)